MLIRSPASSANLGPGFDCLALALDLPFWLATDEQSDQAQRDLIGRALIPAEDTHPAAVAFRTAGGSADQALWWGSGIPPGRGLGFSGAARVAGAYLALRSAGASAEDSRTGAFGVAAELEGHTDNAAASAHGGFVVSSGRIVVPVEVPDHLCTVAWSPAAATSTKASRSALRETVPLEDAADAVGRACLWVAAMCSDRPELTRVACEDRLHQPARLAERPDSAAALSALLGHDDVLSAWLSGSGPSVAALVAGGDAEAVASLPALVELGGEVRVLRIDRAGTTEP